MRSLALALAAVSVSLVACSSAKDVPSTTKGLDGFAVTLEARASKVDKGELVWDGVARNDEKKALIGLSIALSLKRADGSVVETIDASPIASRERVTVLEPGFSIPIHLKQRVSEMPATIEAKITQAERFAEDADAPQPLVVKALPGADAAVLEAVPLGHFHVGSFSGEAGPSPFRMSLGIKSKSGAPISRAELQIVFADAAKKEVDRISVLREFVPPLKPGDAVIEPVSGDARPYAEISVEVRTLTRAE
jgi:hypothetical protein